MTTLWRIRLQLCIVAQPSHTARIRRRNQCSLAVLQHCMASAAVAVHRVEGSDCHPILYLSDRYSATPLCEYCSLSSYCFTRKTKVGNIYKGLDYSLLSTPFHTHHTHTHTSTSSNTSSQSTPSKSHTHSKSINPISQHSKNVHLHHPPLRSRDSLHRNTTYPCLLPSPIRNNNDLYWWSSIIHHELPSQRPDLPHQFVSSSSSSLRHTNKI